MATEHDAPEREDELDNLDQGQGDADNGDQGAQGQDDDLSDNQGGDDGDGAGDHDDDYEIVFGDEAAPDDRPGGTDLVKHLRQINRDQADKLARYERGEVPAPKTIEVGPKPTLESCEYDEDRYDQEMDAWKERQRANEQAQTQATQAQQSEQQRFAERLQVFERGKATMKARDFDVAQAAVETAMSPVQLAVMVRAAEDPAKVVYALGRHSQKLATLAAIKDPIEFAVALTKLEGTLKVTSRKAPPEPDTPIRGAGSFTPSSDPKLDRLEKQAARTGDRTELMRYRKELREKAAKSR